MYSTSVVKYIRNMAISRAKSYDYVDLSPPSLRFMVVSLLRYTPLEIRRVGARIDIAQKPHTYVWTTPNLPLELTYTYEIARDDAPKLIRQRLERIRPEIANRCRIIRTNLCDPELCMRYQTSDVQTPALV